MKKLLLINLILVLALFSASSAWAQTRTVSGRVTGPDGLPLPGVTVLEKGTTNGMATGVDGSYSITVPENATLTFSFIGFATQEVPVAGRSEINIQLAPDTRTLSEVVVTALGIERETRALGYSVSEIQSDQVVQRSEPDVLRTLQGKVPGVNIIGSSGVPGSSTNITIRGNSSLLNNNQPLFVVDGIPFDNDLVESEDPLIRGASYSNRAADIDPNNIESISVLKGAAAAALYGSRAANGVVVITTKAGSARMNPKGLGVVYSTSYSIEDIVLPDYQNKYGSGANGVFSYANGSWGPGFDWGPEYSTSINSFPHPYVRTAALRAAFPQFAEENVPYQAYPDNVKDFFNTGHVFENSVTLNGGTERASFTGVVSRMNQEGMIPESQFNRTNISIGGNSNLSDKLRVGGTLSYTNSAQRGPSIGASNAIGNASAFARILFIPRNINLSGFPYINPLTRGSAFGWLTGQADNPYWSVQNNSFSSNVDRISGNINASYNILDWLSVSYRIGTNTYTDRRRTTVRPGSVGFSGLGAVQEDAVRFQEIESNLLLTADRNLTEDITLRAILGHNVNHRETDISSVQGSNIIIFGIDQIKNTTDIIPDPNAIAGLERRRLFGIFADVQFGYRDFLYLNVTGRNDWSSTLPVANRSFFYPSVSSSLVFTEALDLQSDILDYGKIRASWSRVGNDAAPYSLMQVYQINPFFGNNVGGVGFPFLGNPGSILFPTAGDPNLTPEFTTEVELGTDLNFFDNRIGLNFTWYSRRSTNQIGAIQTPPSTGLAQRITNFGEITNKGVELGLDITPVRTGSFTWNTFTNFTRNRNKVVSLAEGVEEVIIEANFGSAMAVHRPGEEFGIIVGSAVARDPETNKPLINPQTGYMLLARDPKVIGNPNPRFLVGFTNTFSYKGLSLSALVDYRHGGDIYSTTIESYLGRGVTTDTEDREKAVIIDGVFGDPITLTPLAGSGGAAIPNNIALSMNDLYFGTGSFGINTASEMSVYDGTNIRLREVTMGYEIPASLVSKTFLTGINVSLSARNLWWFAPNMPKGTNFDPETSTYGAGNVQGFEFTNAPSARRYGVNLRFAF